MQEEIVSIRAKGEEGTFMRFGRKQADLYVQTGKFEYCNPAQAKSVQVAESPAGPVVTVTADEGGVTIPNEEALVLQDSVKIKSKSDPDGVFYTFSGKQAVEYLRTGKFELYTPKAGEETTKKALDAEKNLQAVKALETTGEEDARQSVIIQAIHSLPEDAFTKAAGAQRPSKPKIDAINAAVGFEITAVERDIAWAKVQAERAGD